MKPLNLTREDLEQLLHDDMEFSEPEQSRFTTEAVRQVGEDGALMMMESVRDQGLNFSWKKFTEKMRSLQRESGQTATAYAPYYRLGVNVLVAGGYKGVALPYSDLAATKPSSTLAQPYASGYRPTMPQKGFGGKKPKQVSFQPRSKVVTNEDFNSFWDLERKAIEDDQTGQFNKVTAQMGENHSVQRQVYFDAFISDAARTAYGVSVPAPDYTDNDGLPGVYNATRGNRPITFGALTEANIEAGLESIMQMTQPGPEGQLILINPDVCYVSVKDKFNAKRLFSSENAPAVSFVPLGNQTGPFSINPIKGELRPVVSAHLTNYAWYIMESKADSLIIQERHPLEVAMEDPNAGESFSLRAYRYRTFMRWAMFWYECRYVYQGHN